MAGNVVIDIPGKKKAAFGLTGTALQASVHTDGLFNTRNDQRLIIRLIYSLMKKLFEEEKLAIPDVLMLVIRLLF